MSVELIIDSFAGGGGASLGIELALGRSPDIAINHDREAIALHQANHPTAKHFPEDVWQVDPMTATNGRPVGLMWLSPDCKHFSKAKGGKPVSKRVRGLAWVACRWAKAVKPRVIVLENVEEFQTWGPVLASGRPCPDRKGLTFRRFCGRLRNLGYEVQWRELRACDYGAPTIRKRLFLIARCDGQPIVWPTPTHGKYHGQPWRTAAECIDWSISCPSIFERAKPLAHNTQRRIAAGLRRYVIESARPFIVQIQNASSGNAPISIDAPMRTVTAHPKGGGFALVAPMIAPLTHHGADRGQSVEAPLVTVTGAHRGEQALVAATLVHTAHGEQDASGKKRGRGDRDIAEPMPTTLATGNMAVVSAFLAKHQTERHEHEVQAASLFDAMPTVKTRDSSALVTAHIAKLRGDNVGHGADEPFHTVSAGGTHFAEVRAFLVAYYGNEKDGGDLFTPMRTVTSKERFGLVTVDGYEYAIADIGMRMLAPRELYRAQGFPDTYRIDIQYNGKPMTKTAQVRMCGNSVCPPVAAAIVRANLGDLVARARVA